MDQGQNGLDPEQLQEVMFIQYLSILANSGMQQLGKIMNPVTGKLEKNLEAAKATIDLLSMLKSKTRGNLNSREERVLGNALANLQLNYADEANRIQKQNQQEDKK